MSNLTIPPYNASVALVTDLASISPSSSPVIVKDSLRGGIFNWSATGAVDDGITFAGLTGYWVRHYTGYVNKRWFTSGIQGVINSGNNVEVDKGLTSITSTISTQLTPQSDGLVIKGAGCAVTDPIAYPTARVRTSSVLTWDGAADGTMFSLQDTYGTHFHNLSLHGKSSAAVLMHIKYVAQGSGLSKFSNLSLFAATTLIKCGVLVTDGNCADLYFDQIYFTDATNGLQIVNNQGLNYNFQQPTAVRVKSVVRADAGGAVNITMADFITTGEDVSGSYSIHLGSTGDQTFSCIVNGIRFEQGCANFFYASGYGESIITGLVEAQVSSATNKIKLVGHSLTIKESQITSWTGLVNMAALSGRSAYMNFSNVYFNSTKSFTNIKEMFILDTNYPVYITMRNCKSNIGGTPKKLRDFNSSIRDGDVMHECSNVGNNVQKYAYLFAETAQNHYNTIELEVGYTDLTAVIIGVETTTAETIGATLTAKVKWDGTTLTVISSAVSGQFTTGANAFNVTSFVTSVRGGRLSITNPTTGGGTYNYTATIRNR